MHPFYSYLIRSVTCSALFLAYFWLFLRNRRMHAFNRFYLLAAVVFSLVIPLLSFTIHLSGYEQAGNYKLLEIFHSTREEQAEILSGGVAFNILSLVPVVYAAVSTLLLFNLIQRIAVVVRLRLRCKAEKQDGCLFIGTNDHKAPFSFFCWLFWKDTLDPQSITGQKILAHELVHIRQYHSLDKLFLQLILTVCWINPFYWLLQKELALVHEYLADEEAIADRDTETFARMLLQSNYSSAFPDIVHPFFYSPIKRRLLMLQQTNLPKKKLFRTLAVVPLLAGMVIFSSFRISNSNVVVTAKSKFTLALDAGHGGKDAGATGNNGIKEKELNRKIVGKLAELAPAYNINIVNVRPDDEYVALADRAAKVNASDASLFVSIHVNSTLPQPDGTHKNPENDGFELIIEKSNNSYDKSRELASGIAASLDKDMQINTRLAERKLVVLREVQRPSVLIECGYLGVQRDEDRINDPGQLDALCRSIMSGIVAYYNRQ